MATAEGFESRIEALNRTGVVPGENERPVRGWPAIAEALLPVPAPGRSCLIGFDGYAGTDWQAALDHIKGLCAKRNVSCVLEDVTACRYDEGTIRKAIDPYLGDDPVFGKVYRKGLHGFFSTAKLRDLRARLKSYRATQNHVVICHGTGAAMKRLRPLYDVTVYADLTREEVLRRDKDWSGRTGKTQSIGPKKLYYVDFPANDEHRNAVIDGLDFYIDGNRPDDPVMISADLLKRTAAALAGRPFRLKPIYEPGPWGGQWLKRVRDLPEEWVNCAWSYEVIAPEQSLLVSLDAGVLELPWTAFFHLRRTDIMGSVPKRRFGGEFPVRFDYLDTMEGGDLSIQVHPTTPYIRKYFSEAYHQGEMYYIAAYRPGARVNLGIREEARGEDFLAAARRADEEGVAFDYREYVNAVPVAPHDLLLIPPGTVHGSGEGLVVLEISATTYRYTFKIYDHLRPDLNGVMRPVHLGHAFNVINWMRRSSWVRDNLKQEPRVIRSGEGWVEYLIADRKEFFHVVFRAEFEREMPDDTEGRFHILTLVDGKGVLVELAADSDRCIEMAYSETIIVPACLGRYRIVNRFPGRTCRIAKARLR